MIALIICAAVCLIMARRGYKQAERMRAAERNLYYYRRSICEGDMIRLSDGKRVKVVISGRDGVYYRQEGQLKRIAHEEIININLN